MWHEKKVIAWLLRDLTISRVHMQYKRLSPMPWYLPKARSLGIHRIHRPLYGANDRLIVVDTIVCTSPLGGLDCYRYLFRWGYDQKLQILAHFVANLHLDWRLLYAR